jgi:hypothetical protein
MIMKKILKFIISLLLVVYFAGCIKDTGNYEYLDASEVAPRLVSGIEDAYSAITMEKLVIDPQIDGDESDYEYAWYTYPVNNTNVAYDTLGVGRKLDHTVTMLSGTYVLVFKATSKENGTSVYKRSQLTVSSIFGIGYYVNKYEDGVTDLDFVDRYGVVNPNILEQINGESLPGKPVRITYEVNRYSYNVTNADGSVSRIAMKPAMMVCTDEDMRIYHGENIELLKKWDQAFLELPAVKRPQGVWANTMGFMLMNDNAVCFVNNNGSNVGEFGYPYPNGDMVLNPNVAVASSSYLAFDDNAGEFVGYHVQKHGYVKDAVISASPLTLGPVGEAYFTNCDLVYMGSQTYYATAVGRSYAIVRDRETGAQFLWQIGIGNIQYGFIYDYGAGGLPIPSDFGVTEGKVFALKGGSSLALNTVIYYSSGDNRVHYYNPSNQTERRDMITLPEGEVVVDIEHSYDFYYKVDTFGVLSTKDGKWFLRTFNLEGSTPDVVLPHNAEYSGNGLAKNFIYRHANTSITYN